MSTSRRMPDPWFGDTDWTTYDAEGNRRPVTRTDRFLDRATGNGKPAVFRLIQGGRGRQPVRVTTEDLAGMKADRSVIQGRWSGIGRGAVTGGSGEGRTN